MDMCNNKQYLKTETGDLGMRCGLTEQTIQEQNDCDTSFAHQVLNRM